MPPGKSFSLFLVSALLFSSCGAAAVDDAVNVKEEEDGLEVQAALPVEEAVGSALVEVMEVEEAGSVEVEIGEEEEMINLHISNIRQ